MWAKLIGWRIDDEPNLAVYFGRCLGDVIVAVSAVARLNEALHRGFELIERASSQ